MDVFACKHVKILSSFENQVKFVAAHCCLFPDSQFQGFSEGGAAPYAFAQLSLSISSHWKSNITHTNQFLAPIHTKALSFKNE